MGVRLVPVWEPGCRWFLLWVLASVGRLSDRCVVRWEGMVGGGCLGCPCVCLLRCLGCLACDVCWCCSGAVRWLECGWPCWDLDWWRLAPSWARPARGALQALGPLGPAVVCSWSRELQ